MKTLLRIAASLALAALLLWGFGRWSGLSWGELFGSWRSVDLATWTTALGLHAAVYVLRAWRFQLLFPPAARPGIGRLLAVAAAHNLAAYVMPAKTGEAAFVLYARKTCGVSGSQALASLITSRLLDLCTVCAGLGVACSVLAAGRGNAPAWFTPLGAMLAVLAVVIGVLAWKSHWLVALYTVFASYTRLDRTSLGRRADALAQRVSHALLEAGSEGRVIKAALVSAPQWLGIFLFYGVLVRGLGLSETVDLSQAALGSGLAVVANLLPINGFAGFGTQEAGWVLGFGALGVSKDLATATSVGVHMIQLG
ncbi:MAG: flippase-like domain-containing protein, partial [Planctomycetes bacterium]|nr:flippase-like domain-containing protein [Planctomycetota bacterium]